MTDIRRDNLSVDRTYENDTFHHLRFYLRECDKEIKIRFKYQAAT